MKQVLVRVGRADLAEAVHCLYHRHGRKRRYKKKLMYCKPMRNHQFWQLTWDRIQWRGVETPLSLWNDQKLSRWLRESLHSHPSIWTISEKMNVSSKIKSLIKVWKSYLTHTWPKVALSRCELTKERPSGSRHLIRLKAQITTSAPCRSTLPEAQHSRKPHKIETHMPT